MSRLFVVAWVIALGFIAASCSSANDPEPTTKSPCGNGKIDTNEECDGTNLNGSTCVGLGFSAGTPSCNAKTCKLESTTCCNDQCANSGDTQCEADELATCTATTGACRTWMTTKDCTTESKICATSGGVARCKDPNCVDQCTTTGEKQCNGTVIEACSVQNNGCNAWVPGTDCATNGGSCDATQGVVKCASNCTDQCTSGETQCSGNVVQECGQVGDCLGWTNKTDCSSNGEVCSLGSGGATCGPACTNNKCPKVNSQTCIDNKVNTCGKQTDGCLDWAQTDDCTSQGLFCKFGAGGVAACQGTCADPCPTANQKKCNANTVQICKSLGSCTEPQWTIDTTCPLGQACESTGFTCVTAPTTGEDCGTVIPITKGLNTINWTATKLDYLTSTPACSIYALSGPDVVLAYVAPFTGTVDFTIDKPLSTRWTAVVAGGNCGSLAQQITCVSDYTYASMGGAFSVTQGNTYFFYIADTTNGTNPLSNPFTINLAEIDCSTFNASGVTFDPPKSGTSNSLSPKLTVDFDTAVKTTAGSVTVTGNKGTNLSFTIPSSSVAFTNFNKTMTITPGVAFPPGEVVTVSWTGIQDNTCGKAINAANWTFTVITPPCTPGANGMVGTNMTKVATALTILPYYLAPDNSASGYVYVGNSSDLYRNSKTGASLQYVNALAGLSSVHLGYAMAINGNDIFTLDSKLSGAGWMWRISTNGGTSWNVQDFLSVPSVSGPSDSIDAAVAYKGKMYFATSESSTLENTEVWSSAAAPGTLPTPITLEKSIPTELYCVGIAVDDQYYYMTCAQNERLIRVNRTTGAATLITNAYDLNTTASPVIATDTNNDGTADYLYFKGSQSEILLRLQSGRREPVHRYPGHLWHQHVELRPRVRRDCEEALRFRLRHEGHHRPAVTHSGPEPSFREVAPRPTVRAIPMVAYSLSSVRFAY